MKHEVAFKERVIHTKLRKREDEERRVMMWKVWCKWVKQRSGYAEWWMTWISNHKFTTSFSTANNKMITSHLTVLFSIHNTKIMLNMLSWKSWNYHFTLKFLKALIFS